MIMFGDTIIYDAQRQVSLNLKQSSGINSNTQGIMLVLFICKYKKDLNKNCRGNLIKLYFSDAQGQITP